MPLQYRNISVSIRLSGLHAHEHFIGLFFHLAWGKVLAFKSILPLLPLAPLFITASQLLLREKQPSLRQMGLHLLNEEHPVRSYKLKRHALMHNVVGFLRLVYGYIIKPHTKTLLYESHPLHRMSFKGFSHILVWVQHAPTYSGV